MKKVILPVILILFVVLNINAQEKGETEFLWLDTSLPIEERIEALISAMTVDEKITQLVNANIAIPRLGIKEYDWWNECLHGVARNGRATVFPQAIALGATFDTTLAYRVATAISDEARAKFNIAQSLGNYNRYAGLTFWTPNVNIFRDPRWGRGQETYGEDPFLTSRIGVAFVKGLQGDDEKYLKTAACAKHYAVHSGPEELRHEFNAEVTPKDLWETYLPAFEALVKEAKVEAIMGAYNRTNGQACCASPFLLQDILIDQWKFEGHIVSDCGAIQDIWKDHQLCETPEQASAMAIKSGLDVNCGIAFESLKKALSKKLVNEDDLDNALCDLLRTKFRLGFFDNNDENPYSNISSEVVGSDIHRKLALEEAEKSIVLVKNRNQILPLENNLKNVFITGPQAANEGVLLGNYYGVNNNTVNILDGIIRKLDLGTTVNYRYGQLPYQKNINPMDYVTEDAASADVCIAVLGLSGLVEGEEGDAIASDFKGDRKYLHLPQSQIEFIKKIRSYGKEKPLIVIITGGSPIAIPEIYELADAVLYVWYPGQEGGTAVGNVLFGDAVPSGRLPFTIPKSVDDLPPYEDYSMKGRTYKYMTKEPQFPFGFGLSYSTFEYSDLKIDSVFEDQITASVTVTNLGEYDAEEVVQLYVCSPLAGNGDPLYSLRAFQRVSVPSGHAKIVVFNLDRESFSEVDNDGKRVFRDGEYKLWVGGSLPGERSVFLGATKCLDTSIDIMKLIK
ncbi:glycoside hydrolase family 3 C-terminal domain-containing protein [Draconibacterium sediminis]|uniref:glycoside hydrolase family 3 C-terminal domain-containing protein n=1 Tax=Draconibacterium sediminis TaxID=1544798 RepID=UPI0026E9B057|nr:glycoside hydrolase family 3 C-terminal domain-containing protein [Draconibacterium sediminis]